MKHIARIHRNLAPRDCEHLIRLGNPSDGGYLVDSRSIDKTDRLLSLGISTDWTFEKAFSLINPAPIIAFDASIGQRRFLREIIESLSRVDQPRLLYDRLKCYFSYKSFFKSRAKHVSKYVCFDQPPLYISLINAINEYSGDLGNIFLKIDIEGSEYRILDDLISIREKLVGLIVEFHDYDLHIQAINKFAANINMEICHIHANNFAPLTDQGIPTAVEVTFTKFSCKQRDVELPHPLDKPNNPSNPDYNIRFL